MVFQIYLSFSKKAETQGASRVEMQAIARAAVRGADGGNNSQFAFKSRLIEGMWLSYAN